MSGKLRVAALCFAIGMAGLSPASAGIPRGLTLAADEQTGDEETGITIARGNAEVTAPAYAIHGTADVIEVRPKVNEIVFTGQAHVSVGRETYASDAVSCTLDFSRCQPVGAAQALPPSEPIAITLPR